MAHSPPSKPKTPFLSWRNPTFRALVYQVLALGGVLGGGWMIFNNTLKNLEERGISSGFGFLKNEAGFGISEGPPVPFLNTGLWLFLGGIALAWATYWILKKQFARSGKPIWENTPRVTILLLVLIGLPMTAWWLGGGISGKLYEETDAYTAVLATGILNTLKVSLLGCIIATFIGFMVGIARLSSNVLVAYLAAAYIEVIRNIPLLLQIFFWYFAVFTTLPEVSKSLNFGLGFILNQRGFYFPDPVATSGAGLFWALMLAGALAAFFWGRKVNLTRNRTGVSLPLALPLAGFLLVPPALGILIAGVPFHLEYAVLEGFNYEGGIPLTPEYSALLVALSTYHGAYIGENVRSGIQAVSHGQKEAALALGLKSWHVMRLVVIPQALRVIIPPLTNQFLNLIKNSSLGVAIAYPELVSVGGTTLNQSGQAIEVIGLIMVVYLCFSLIISLFMNWYNTKVQMVER